MYRAYWFLSILIYPLLWVHLHYRAWKGKEHPKRLRERLGHARFARPKGPLIWFHAASVGESISILPLIERCAELYPSYTILISTGTLTSASLLEQKLPDNALHHFVPIDSAISVKRFLSHFKPDLALFVESELWPNLIEETQKICPMILLNARISKESLQFWQRYASLSHQMLSAFKLILPQSEEDAEHFASLGATHIVYLGNLKFDSPVLPADAKVTGQLVQMIGDRPLWVAASTHKGEEEQIAKTHLELKEEYPELLTIIIPRHPNRAKEITSQLTQLGLSVSWRSKNEEVKESTDCYLADTMGEMGMFYRLSPIVFIGGSLIAHGGQNPLEAARLECAILAGPHMENFKAITKEFENHQALIRIENQSDLSAQVSMLFHNLDKQDEMAKKALEIVNKKAGILDQVMDKIHPYFNAVMQKE